MQDTLQNSRSSFRERRQAAGYTQDQIAKLLNASRGAVQHWDDGSWRPRWRFMPGLAKLFGIELAEAVRCFWHENVGDPCPCGCGGKKVFPDRPGAKHLYINLPCEQCETDRPPYRTMQGHRALCLGCGKKVERTPLTCDGYRPYPSVVIPIPAKRCPLTRDFLPHEILRFKHKRDVGEGYAFVDVKRGAYRCRFCAGAYRMLRKNEKRLERQWAKAHPNENFPRIRSPEDLKRVQRQLTDQSQFSSERPKRVRGKYPPRVIDATVPERKRKWRREKSPPPLILCGLCGTLACEYHKNRRVAQQEPKKRPTRFHRECVREYQREHGAELAGPRNADGTFTTSKPIEERSRRGAPVEFLQKHFMWTTRHKLLGDSLGEIAKDDDAARSTVVNGIEFIMGKVAKDGSVEQKSVLPRPDLMPPPMRQRITALRALADPRCLV